MRPAQESRRPIWQWLLGVALFVHVGFGVQRLAIKSLPRRLEKIEKFHRLGPVGYHLAKSKSSEQVLEFLAEHTSTDSVILYKGHRGLMEHAAALLWPRLLYDVDAAPAGATTLLDGRPVAKARHPDLGAGILVLTGGKGQPLRLELR